MRPYLAFLLLLFSMHAHAAGLGELAEFNQTNLAQLAPGMSKAEVFQVMHSDIRVETKQDGIVGNPFKTENLMSGQDQIEIIYYITDKNRLFRPIGDKEITPVVLENGKVIGWGWKMVKLVKE